MQTSHPVPAPVASPASVIHVQRKNTTAAPTALRFDGGSMPLLELKRRIIVSAFGGDAGMDLRVIDTQSGAGL